MGSKWKSYPLRKEAGFTLVELMVVVSIIGILSAVAVPAYINYINRTKQSEAASGLLTARLEMEEFYTDNGHYPSTIQCLPSFVPSANTTACLTCSATCPGGSITPKYYTYSFLQAGTNYRISAARKMYSYAQTDVVTISATTDSPIVQNTSALKFSVFQWLFK